MHNRTQSSGAKQKKHIPGTIIRYTASLSTMEIQQREQHDSTLARIVSVVPYIRHWRKVGSRPDEKRFTTTTRPPGARKQAIVSHSYPLKVVSIYCLSLFRAQSGLRLPFSSLLSDVRGPFVTTRFLALSHATPSLHRIWASVFRSLISTAR